MPKHSVGRVVAGLLGCCMSGLCVARWFVVYGELFFSIKHHLLFFCSSHLSWLSYLGLLPLCFISSFTSLQRSVVLKRNKGRMRFSYLGWGVILYLRLSLLCSGGEETWWEIDYSRAWVASWLPKWVYHPLLFLQVT